MHVTGVNGGKQNELNRFQGAQTSIDRATLRHGTTQRVRIDELIAYRTPLEEVIVLTIDTEPRDRLGRLSFPGRLRDLTC